MMANILPDIYLLLVFGKIRLLMFIFESIYKLITKKNVFDFDWYKKMDNESPEAVIKYRVHRWFVIAYSILDTIVTIALIYRLLHALYFLITYV